MSQTGYTYKYPHPAVTTDCVVFGYDGNNLHVLLVERGREPYKGCWALPGGFVDIDETVEEGALRELAEETHVQDIYLEQFHVFSAVDRDPRERVLSVAFFALVRKSDYQIIGGDDAVRAEWFPIASLPSLAFDHSEIIRMAKERLQEVLQFRPIAFKLLYSKFTMDELQKLYELIYENQFDRHNFQENMLATGYLQDEGPCNTQIQDPASHMFSFKEEVFHEDQLRRTIPKRFFDF